MNLDKSNIQEILADILMDRPREFYVADRRFLLWTPSLGTYLLIERHIKALGIDIESLAANPAVETLRLVSLHRDKVCYIVALHTFRRFVDFCNSNKISRRAKFFASRCTVDEIARLFMLTLTFPTISQVAKASGIAEEQKKQARIAHIKDEKGHSVSFGGKTLAGSLIAPACKALRMTPRQVAWDISLITLQLLMADAVNTVYLSEEEARKAHIPTGLVLDAGDSRNMQRIQSFDWS